MYKARFGEESSFEITEDFIAIKDAVSEVNIRKSEILQIDEIQDFYFIKLKNGMSLIFSKAKALPDELAAFKNEINKLATNGIHYNIELNWKWR